MKVWNVQIGDIAFLVLETYKVEARGTSADHIEAARIFRETLEIRANLKGARAPLGETLEMYRQAGWAVTEVGSSMNPADTIY